MRGMAKWLPFKSLSGQYEVLNQHEIERQKVEKPELEEDEIEKINQTLIQLKKGDYLSITYYDNGFFKDEESFLYSLDEITQTIRLKNNTTIKFENIIKIKKIIFEKNEQDY